MVTVTLNGISYTFTNEMSLVMLLDENADIVENTGRLEGVTRITGGLKDGE